jgi:DNA-binding Lrp family transcriptional regulator
MPWTGCSRPSEGPRRPHRKDIAFWTDVQCRARVLTMSLDPFDVMVLRAMLRLARRRQAANDGEIAVRVSRPPSAVRGALRRLAELGLVERRVGDLSPTPRLTMSGFALAVALLPGAARPSTASRRAPRAA